MQDAGQASSLLEGMYVGVQVLMVHRCPVVPATFLGTACHLPWHRMLTLHTCGWLHIVNDVLSLIRGLLHHGPAT